MKKRDNINNSSIFGLGRKDPMNGDLFLKELREVFEKHGVNSIVGGSIKVQGKVIILNHVELDISDKKRMREHPPVSIK